MQVLVFGGLPTDPRWAAEGISEVSIPQAVVPLKPPLLAELKSNNYMLNALTMMAAQVLHGCILPCTCVVQQPRPRASSHVRARAVQERGGTFGILVDDAGWLLESCVLIR